MKKIAVVIASTILIVGCVSWEKTDPSLLGPQEYAYQFEGKSQDELYSLSRLWIANVFNSAEAVLSFEDEETGTLKGNGVGQVKIEGDLYVRGYAYNMAIDVRDERARIIFSNVQPRMIAGVAGTDMSYQFGYDAITADFEELAMSFEDALSGDVQSDW